MSTDSLFFFEQTDFSLRFARCAITDTSLHIPELKEVALTDLVALSQLAPADAQIVCSLRPKLRKLHLASAEEAKNHAGVTGVKRFAQLPQFAAHEPGWFAAVQARDGTAPGAAPWLLSTTSSAAYQQAREVFTGIKLKPARCLDATLSTIATLASPTNRGTLLLEIGEISSQAVLVAPAGVRAAGAVTLNLDQIAEAIQTELKLKFRGSAAKLFFNADCDFTETGPRIAAQIAVTLKKNLAPLLAGQPAPTALCCAGLPAAQHWFGVQLAAALGLAPYTPDLKAWSHTAGVTFAQPGVESSIPPEWFSFLHFINSQTLEGPAAWQSEWLQVKPTEEKTVPVAAPRVPTAVTASVSRIEHPAPVVTLQPFATPVPASAPLKPKPTPAVAAKPKPVPSAAKTAPAPSPIKAAPPSSIATSPGVASSVSYQAGPPPKSKAALSIETKIIKKRSLLFASISVAFCLLAGVGYYFFQARAETTRIAQEKTQAEARLKIETNRAQLADQKIREATEARKKFELESATKIAAAEAARDQAETEARNQLATRLANARGTLVVTTLPAGASVTIDDQPPRISPATFSFLKIGKYSATLALANHETKTVELEVQENLTTEPNAIQLTSIVGGLEITTEPAGASYELRPVRPQQFSVDAPRAGQTPAKLTDLPPSDYTLTFTKAGWASHTETITVARDALARSHFVFPRGEVKITSNPSGATVKRGGTLLGVTPLSLQQPPGEVKFEVSLSGYELVILPGRITESGTLELVAQLPLSDRIFGMSELDQRPQPVNPKTPDLPPAFTRTEGRVDIQLTVNRDGSTSDLKVLRASQPEIGRIYVSALSKWKFKPGTLDGQPVRCMVVVPFLISAAN